MIPTGERFSKISDDEIMAAFGLGFNGCNSQQGALGGQLYEAAPIDSTQEGIVCGSDGVQQQVFSGQFL